MALIGATGLVGRSILSVMEESGLSPKSIAMIASERSAGSKIEFNGKSFEVEALSEKCLRGFDIAIFAAGSSVSKEWAPRFASDGTIVIDKSSAWRGDPECPLVVPQVNPEMLDEIPKGIVSSPNCSTAGLVIALKPLVESFGTPEHIFVATYQAVSGAGKGGIETLARQRRGEDYKGVFERPIFDNVLPVIGKIDECGFNVEETKLLFETRRILAFPKLQLTATAVRVPLGIGHSEAATMVFSNEVPAYKAIEALNNASGIRVLVGDDYPTPLAAAGIDDVLVGRIRNTPGDSRVLSLFISFDNLRRGAATNAVELAQLIAKRI